MSAHANFGRLQRIIKGEEQVGEGLPRMRCKVCKYAMANKEETNQEKRKKKKGKEKKENRAGGSTALVGNYRNGP